MTYKLMRTLKFCPLSTLYSNAFARKTAILFHLRDLGSVASQKIMSAAVKRGALIVFEGCDKSGKSTQCSLLVDRLTQAGIQAQLMKFPDRTTVIGTMINNYLQQSCQLEDHVIHLLFAANRWEAMPEMTKLLNNGVTLVVDRYSFSGVAFSSAKPNMEMEWCRQPETGLLKPDRVLYLTLPAEVASQRGDYGTERYEKKDFQVTVARKFEELMDETWDRVNADKTVDELSQEIFEKALKVLERVQYQKLHKLWVGSD